VTAVVLVFVFLAWTQTFYRDFYAGQARSSDAPEREEPVVRTPAPPPDPAASTGSELSRASPDVLPGGRDADVTPGDPAVDSVLERVFYAPGGPVKAEGLRVDGRREGEWTWYYPDSASTPERRGRYENDLREGPWTYWYPSGQKRFEGSYGRGLRDGEWRSWHENGQPEQIAQFEDNERVGYWQRFYADGTEAESGNYDERGRRTGWWVFRTASGEEDGRTGFYVEGVHHPK